MKNKLVKVKIIREVDDVSDLSHLGEFTDKWQEGAIEHHGDRNNYKYFVSCNHSVYKPENWSHISKKEKQKIINSYGSLENVEKSYARHDYRRMMQFVKGDVCFYGIYAEAEIYIPKSKHTHIIQYIKSNGLWGVESDSGEKCFSEIEQEELKGLKDTLEKLNVDCSNFEELSKNLEPVYK